MQHTLVRGPTVYLLCAHFVGRWSGMAKVADSLNRLHHFVAEFSSSLRHIEAFYSGTVEQWKEVIRVSSVFLYYMRMIKHFVRRLAGLMSA